MSAATPANVFLGNGDGTFQPYLLTTPLAFGAQLADLNNDGFVDAADLALLLNNWNGIGIGDINQDGGVDAQDVAIMLNAWS